ncbi:hypothetical protein J3R83DRAFT_4153 [Lanmaoa asiatica]|nr:hypothetical protein J3R83DRAFT_4153 [Lanmaoa asiatica]
MSIHITASGFNPHLPGARYQFLSKALGATMWFFIFYRARWVVPARLFAHADASWFLSSPL